MIPVDTPYKVIKYLVNLFDKKIVQKNYEKEKLVIYLLERKYILETGVSKTKFTKTKHFDEYYFEEILPMSQKYDSFIKKHQIEKVEHHCSINDLESLILIEQDRLVGLTLQEILAKYFRSSKHADKSSSLANAIKTILNLDEFVDDHKDQQFVSILYPKGLTKFIVLCENKNRLRAPRHSFIEFWYAGGKNTTHLKFIPKPQYPIFYLFDWDFDGLNTYIEIKQKYFPKLAAFIPANFQLLFEKQEDVKYHNSVWKNDLILAHLNKTEKIIVSALIETNSIIEEQKILVTEENFEL
jgi:hypothetical protein